MTKRGARATMMVTHIETGAPLLLRPLVWLAALVASAALGAADVFGAWA